MAASSFSIATPFSAINLCVISFVLLFPFISWPCASQEAFDLSYKCPHVLTTANIKNKRPTNESFLVVVPWAVGFERFATFNRDSCSFDGFSIKIFREAAVRFPYEFVLHGDGIVPPSYEEMIEMVVRGEADAVVADLTITSERMEKVRFSAPFLASSLVMVTPFRYKKGTPWDFLKPFSMPLWITLVGCFMATGVGLYLLENQNPDFSPPCKKHHDANSSSHGSSAHAHTPPHDSTCDLELAIVSAPLPHIDNINPPSSNPTSVIRLGPPIYDASHRYRILNAYWFTSLCVFAAQQESVRSHLGRFVTVMWLFVMLVFNSSYTASLVSLLSAQERLPAIKGFQDLLQDNNISVGYLKGSFMNNYINNININENILLKKFSSPADYAKALKEGNLKPSGVGAVLDELPYIQILLQSECDLAKIDDDDSLPSFGGFGFAFDKNSSKIEEVSMHILEMEEDGKLQELKDTYKIGGKEKNRRCKPSEDTSQLRLKSFGGLFSILLGVYVSCILMNLVAKAIKSKEGSHGPLLTNAIACVPRGCNVCHGGGFLRSRSNKVSDVSL